MPVKKFISNFLVIFLLLGAILAASYYYHQELSFSLQKVRNQIFPCSQTITYSIGVIDPKFNLSPLVIENDLSQAAQIWNQGAGKMLISSSTDGQITVNLVYDKRQQATDILKGLGLVIDNGQASFQEVKKEYDLLNGSYDQQKTALNQEVNSYQAANDALNYQVKDLNAKGGATPDEVVSINQKRTDLNNQYDKINHDQSVLNTLVLKINALAGALNKMIAILNLNINDYNTIGGSNGDTFEEGEYVQDMGTQTINIFQFDNETKLTRVVAHEFGHALGLDHVSNTDSIMYPINQGNNLSLTADDLAALKKQCKN